MKKNKLVNFLYGLIAIAAIFGLYSFTTNSFSDYTGEYQPKWENLKVLPQDISKDSLNALMEGYNASLGVKCSHCHTPKKDDPSELDFADDSKMAKIIARGMIEMTHDINEKYFKPHYPDPKPDRVTDVSCVMCHRGTAKPKEYLENVGGLFPTLDVEKVAE